MANDPSDERGPEPLVTSSSFPQRQVLTLGIAAACLLGAGAGLWARPGDADQRPAAPVAKYVAEPVPQSLEIVVDDGPAPIGKPIEVLPAGLAPATAAAPRAPDLTPLAPTAALLKAQAVDAAAIAADPAPVAAPEPPKVEAPPPTPRVEKVRAAKTPAEPAKKAVERKPAAKPKAATKVAKAEPPAKAPSRVGKVRKALAKGAPRKPEAKKPETKVAKAEPPKPKPKPKATTPERETRLAKAEKPAGKVVRVAKASNRCVSADPGAALVCADPALGAADRRLTRAYREAEAAGVPVGQLRQQQQRWLAARAAAAREAPWAVHDVYLARIAELQDMTRDVRDGY